MHTKSLLFVGAALASLVTTLGCDGSSSGTRGTGGASSTLPNNTAGGSTSSSTSTTGGKGVGGSTAASTLAGATSVDVLLMVDNSQSMGDKQGLLAAAVPRLVARLIQPNCVSNDGTVVGQSQLDGTCTQGTAEFKPVSDIHVGVVTSSLGDHGANQVCSPGTATAYTDSSGNPVVEPGDVNDMSHLVGTLTRGVSAIQADGTIVQSANVKLPAQGFLAWGGSNQTPSSTDLTSAQHAFTDMIQSVGERGCGYEAQLESWFRFLIDPVPPILPLASPDQAQTHRTGSDDALLAERAAFLRPNSLLAIVMLTDENDCSVRDMDVGWVSATTSKSIPPGSPMCATNPNDKCCFNCSTATPPSGCQACPSTSSTATDDSLYQANIRCWHQKRRFGYDFMYPVSRYVVGLTHAELCPDQTFGDMDCDCTYANSLNATCNAGSRRLPNPLFSNIVGQDNAGQNVRGATQVAPRVDNSNILLAGIVGVPWQDLGYLDTNGTLKYIAVTDPAWKGSAGSTAPATPNASGIWAQINGDDNANIVPGDVHMVESLEPRPGIPGPTAAATADPIVGHDYNTAYEDFEYACIFKFPTPRTCQCSASNTDFAFCQYQHPNECCNLTYGADGRGGPGGSYNKPVCQGSDQVAAKAYPGQREIAVLHDYATGVTYASSAAIGNSIVASICPKDLTGDTAAAGYGFNPAIDAIISRMAEKLPRN
jgi:hypothetical protein